MADVTSLKGAIRKTILRNVEVPLPASKSKKSTLKSSKNKNLKVDKDNKSKDQICDTLNHNKEKYHKPKLNTALDVKEKLEKIHLSEVKKIESVSQLTPKSKNMVAHEVTKRLNFPADEEIFKDLISINVNDSVSMIPEKRKPIRKKYTGKTSKDPIPELADFLKPIEPLKYVIPLYDKIDTFRKPKNDNFNEFYELHTDYHFEF